MLKKSSSAFSPYMYRTHSPWPNSSPSNSPVLAFTIADVRRCSSAAMASRSSNEPKGPPVQSHMDYHRLFHHTYPGCHVDLLSDSRKKLRQLHLYRPIP